MAPSRGMAANVEQWRIEHDDLPRRVTLQQIRFSELILLSLCFF